MRRLAAILLIGLFSFSLLAPMVWAQSAESRMPECCRRAGKHHCTVAGQSGQHSGPGMLANCRLYPQKATTAASGATTSPRPALTSFAVIPARCAVVLTHFTPYRLAYSRSDQKRGPPLS